jgi:hypothetical protein
MQNRAVRALSDVRRGTLTEQGQWSSADRGDYSQRPDPRRFSMKCDAGFETEL